MTRLFALWAKEMIALSRDRHGLLALFLMPAIFILLMTVALRDVFAPGAVIEAPYVVVDTDHSAQSQALVRRLEGLGVFVAGPGQRHGDDDGDVQDQQQDGTDENGAVACVFHGVGVISG